MATVSNQDFFDANLQNIIAASRLEMSRRKEKGEDPKAMLASLTKTLEEVMGQIGKNKDSKAKGAALPSSLGSQGPSNAEMQKVIGVLMGLLGTLEMQLAQLGNDKAQASNEIGQALIQEMNAQVKQASQQLQNVLSDQNSSDFWGNFLKAMEIVVGVVIAAVSVLCGQFAVAAIVIVMTVLSVSGAMSKATQAISTDLQNDGCPKDIANVISSAIVIVIAIVATALTCGAASGAAAEQAVDTAAETAENSVEMSDMSANSADSTADAAPEMTDEVGSSTSRLSKIGNWLKQGGPFKSLPRPVNMAIFTGSQAMMSSNFAQYLATVCLSGMKEGQTKDALTTLIEVIVNLLAAIAGAGSGAATCAGGITSEFSKAASLLNVLEKGKTFAYSLQMVGQGAEGVTQLKLASDMDTLGQLQALQSLIQSLMTMNSNQAQADMRSLNGILRAHAEEMETLTADLNKGPAAIASVLQA